MLKVYLSIPHRFELPVAELDDIIRTYKIKLKDKLNNDQIAIINDSDDFYFMFGDSKRTTSRMITNSITAADIIVYTSKERDDLVIFEKDVANYIKLPGVTIL